MAEPDSDELACMWDDHVGSRSWPPTVVDTLVIEGARLELLRVLLRTEDLLNVDREKSAAAGEPDHLPTHYPLFTVEWSCDRDDVLLAAKEAWLLGHIEFNAAGRHPNGPMVRITPAGAGWIRGRDMKDEAGRAVMAAEASARRAALKLLK